MSAPHYLGVWDTLWYYLVLPCTSSDSYSLAEAFYPDKPPTVFTLTIIKPNNEIYSFDFRFDKIFIRKAGSEETDILGVATLKNGLATNEFYRIYEVKPCTQIDYGLYVANFKTTYNGMRMSMNLYAMDGVMLFIQDDKAPAEPEENNS